MEKDFDWPFKGTASAKNKNSFLFISSAITLQVEFARSKWHKLYSKCASC